MGNFAIRESRRLYWRGALAAMGAVVLPVLMASCGAENSKRIIKECVLPADQSGTITGRFPVAPIPLAFKEGQWNSFEMTEIVAAVNTWNAFHVASKGFPLFDIGSPANPRTANLERPTPLCDTEIVTDGAFTAPVMIHKHGAWPFTGQEDAIGITSFCSVAGDPMPQKYMGVIEFNYDDFFGDGKKNPDLQTTALHEFGHLFGLNHSCATGDASGFPNCNGQSLAAEYFFAVLYPKVFFDGSLFGEVRRQLQDNDMGRANCIYN